MLPSVRQRTVYIAEAIEGVRIVETHLMHCGYAGYGNAPYTLRLHMRISVVIVQSCTHAALSVNGPLVWWWTGMHGGYGVTNLSVANRNTSHSARGSAHGACEDEQFHCFGWRGCNQRRSTDVTSVCKCEVPRRDRYAIERLYSKEAFGKGRPTATCYVFAVARHCSTVRP